MARHLSLGACMFLLALRCGVAAGFIAAGAWLDIGPGYILLLVLLVLGVLLRLACMGLLCGLVLYVAQTPVIWELTRSRPLQIAAWLAGALLILLVHGAGRFSIDHWISLRYQRAARGGA